MITIIAIAFIVLLAISIFIALAYAILNIAGESTKGIVYWFIAIPIGWIAFFNIAAYVLK